MKIQQIKIDTCMGKVSTFFGNPLSFLSDEEFKNFNEIGYTGKLNGIRISREDYLNSLNKGTFDVTQTKWDNGDFSESFNIVRVTKN